MDFEQAEISFKHLKEQFQAGGLSETDFKSQLEELMVQDEKGSWWMIGYETERWYRYDGANWVQAIPPVSPGSAQDVILREREEPQVSEKTDPEIAEREAVEIPSLAEIDSKVAETPANAMEQIRGKSLTNKGFLFSWQWRMLLGGGVGLILGILTNSLEGLILLPIACGLAGLITFPHKLSILFLLLGFFVTGIISSPDFSDPEAFVGFGALIGIPAGALLSRILHRTKVLR